MKFGHRGANQPVKDLDTGLVEITSQNHGFAFDGETMGCFKFEIDKTNLNDQTVEGIRHRKKPLSAFSITRKRLQALRFVSTF